MAYPVFAPGDTWYRGTTPKGEISAILFLDISTTKNPVEQWNGDIDDNGAILCKLFKSGYIDNSGNFVENPYYTLEISGNGSGKISLNENSKGMFSDYEKWTDYFVNLVGINQTNILDFSLVKDMSYFFYGCEKLKVINVSDWDMSNVQNIAAMFCDCSSLETIDISNWNVENMTDFWHLFDGCSSLTEVDLSKWKLSKGRAYSLKGMFIECSSLTSFGDCSEWDIECKSMYMMFFDCAKLKEISLGKITFNTIYDSEFQHVFNGCTNLETVKSRGITFNLNMRLVALFQGCSKLKNLDMNIDFSKVTDISFMLYGCTGLKEIDVSDWDVSNVTNFDHFAAHANLKRKGIEKWNTSSAINMNAMFHNCAEEELDLSGYDVSNVKYFSQMFENSPNLKRIKGLEKWDTSSGVGFDEMFGRCRKLEEVDLSSFDTSKAKNGEKASTNGHTTNTFSNIFQECNNLKKITLGPKFSINGDGTNTSATKKLTFPTPSATYIQEADGNWYDIEGNSYAPDGMLDKTAKTYYAVLSEAFDSDTVPVMVNRGSLTKVAHALRKKTGKTGKMKLNSFSEEIDSFEGEMLILDDNTTIEAETLIIGGV